MNSKLVSRNVLLFAVAIFIASCGTATFTKTGSDATIESLRNFELAFIDQFAVPGKKFNAAAFNAKVNEGNAKFQQAITDQNSPRVLRSSSIGKDSSTLTLRICEAKPGR